MIVSVWSHYYKLHWLWNAQERNERLDSLRHTEEEVLREQANASKVNKRSENLLRKKYVSLTWV